MKKTLLLFIFFTYSEFLLAQKKSAMPEPAQKTAQASDSAKSAQKSETAQASDNAKSAQKSETAQASDNAKSAQKSETAQASDSAKSAQKSETVQASDSAKSAQKSETVQDPENSKKTETKDSSPTSVKDETLEELKLFAEGAQTLQAVWPSDIPSLEKLAGQYKNSRDFRSWLKAVNMLISHKPKNIRYQFEKIQAQKALEYDPFPSQIKRNEIVENLQKIIKKNPRFQPPYWLMLDIIHHYNDWTEGTTFYKEANILQALNLIKDMAEKFGENSKTHQYKCIYLVKNNFYDEAKKECLKFKNLNPQNPTAYLYADYFLSEEKEKNLLAILKKFPKSKEIYTHTAQMFLDKKDLELSLKYFKKALSLDDQYFPALLGTAENLFKTDQVKEALGYYLQACKKNKIKTRIPFQKAKARLSQKNLFQQANEYQNGINFCLQ